MMGKIKGNSNLCAISIGENNTIYMVPRQVKHYFEQQNQTFDLMHDAVNAAKEKLEEVEKLVSEAFDEGYDEGKKAAQKALDEGIMLTPPIEGGGSDGR